MATLITRIKGFRQSARADHGEQMQFNLQENQHLGLTNAVPVMATGHKPGMSVKRNRGPEDSVDVRPLMFMPHSR